MKKGVIIMLKVALIAGALNLIVSFAISFLSEAIIPGLSAQYQNPAIFRPWTDPLMMVYFAYPFILAAALFYLWGFIKAQLKGSNFEKAFQFAKICFIVATIPGMFVTYTTFQLSLFMVIIWVLSGFCEAYVAGFVFAKVK